MQTTLAALAVLAAGYILAYLLFDRLRDRYGYVGGAEYVLHRCAARTPRSPGLLDAGPIQDLTPIVSLADRAGSACCSGPTSGCRRWRCCRRDHLRIAFAEAVATFAFALGALLALFRYFAGHAWPDAAVEAVTLAAVATLCSPAAVDALVTRARARSPSFRSCSSPRASTP